MAKEILKKELERISYKPKDHSFYTVELISVGYNQLQLITTEGKFGNKGTSRVKRLTDYKEAMDLAYRTIWNKEDEGYVDTEKMQPAVEETHRREKRSFKKNASQKSGRAEYRCGKCGKALAADMHKRINEWARGEGNWDADPGFVGYRKVLCVPCQVELDIFKKKVSSNVVAD